MIRRMVMMGVVLATALWLREASAVVPAAMNAQGRLTDLAGAPLPAGSKTLIFRIYSDSTGGVQIWPAVDGESQSVDTDSGGLWNCAIGAVSPLTDDVFSEPVRWLEIRVDDGINPVVMLPRVPLLTGPFAQRVATVDGASGGAISSKVSIGPGHVSTGAETFVAGMDNEATGDYSAVGGGATNSASGEYATIGGGSGNAASEIGSTVAGGESNQALGEHSTVGGGSNNFATGLISVVAGGSDNHATLLNASVGGGALNLAGGIASTVGGGVNNSATGINATVPGGWLNEAVGASSFAAGRQAKALHDGCFVWADDQAADFASTGANQFMIRALGGVAINTDSVVSILTIQRNSPTDPIADAWPVYSSRRWKKDIEPIHGATGTVERLQGVTYRWKADDKPDIGLIAEDVGAVIPEVVAYEANGVDALSVDYARLVALLIEAVKEQQKRIEALESRIDQMSQ